MMDDDGFDLVFVGMVLVFILVSILFLVFLSGCSCLTHEEKISYIDRTVQTDDVPMVVPLFKVGE